MHFIYKWLKKCRFLTILSTLLAHVAAESCRKHPSPLNFSHVCPEPVLVNDNHFAIQHRKRRFLHRSQWHLIDLVRKAVKVEATVGDDMLPPTRRDRLQKRFFQRF